jgi:hypothetical protein
MRKRYDERKNMTKETGNKRGLGLYEMQMITGILP